VHIAHHPIFVALSILIACIGSWTALDLFHRVRAHQGAWRGAWLAASGIGMGLSIWSMHFIAMLGFNPGSEVRYRIGLTVLSLLIAMGATTFAFFSAGDRSARRLLSAGTFMGLSICAMHYVGMSAVLTSAHIAHDPRYVALAGIVAITASIGALLVARTERSFLQRALAAIVLGFAIVGMHYVAMLGVVLTPSTASDPVTGSGIDPVTLAFGVAGGTFLILFLSLIAALSDRRFEALAAREAVRSERRLRSILEHLPFGVFVASRPSGEIQFANAEADRLLQHPVVGSTVWNSEERHGAIGNDGKPLPAQDHALYQAMHEGHRVGPRVQAYRRGDGSIVQFEVTAAPISHDNERDAFALVAFQDVTAKLLAEQRVSAALADKAQAQEALMHAQRLEALGRLTGGVAHDFNNLLTVVIGALDIILRHPENAARRTKLGEAALAAAKRGERLTAQLLAFARRQPLRTETCDLNELIRQGEPLMQRAAGDRLSLTLRLSKTPPLTRLDPSQMESALLNLIVNAVDATPSGGTITIETQLCELSDNEFPEVAAGPFVAVRVADTGEGISEEIIAHIFEPFFTTKQPGKGTGLGLSQVYGFVRQSGGAVRVHSVHGKGTTFELYLPMAEVDATTSSQAQPKLDRLGRALTILLVEDDASVAAITETMLKNLGHTVTRTHSAGQALETAMQSLSPFDALVTDIAMPGGMNGVELARRVTLRLPELKVLLVSGYADESVDESLATERWSFLKKPYLQDDLDTALRAMFEETSDIPRMTFDSAAP
jgi:PAS domain S-box-containing protein